MASFAKVNAFLDARIRQQGLVEPPKRLLIRVDGEAYMAPTTTRPLPELLGGGPADFHRLRMVVPR